jgi:hypothetical protein
MVSFRFKRSKNLQHFDTPQSVLKEPLRTVLRSNLAHLQCRYSTCLGQVNTNECEYLAVVHKLYPTCENS